MFTVLGDEKFNNTKETSNTIHSRDIINCNYLLLPSSFLQQSCSVDWSCINSVHFPSSKVDHRRPNCSAQCQKSHVHTVNGLVCKSELENCLVYTPHNGIIYCITQSLDGLDGNSPMTFRGGDVITCKSYYKNRLVFCLLYYSFVPSVSITYQIRNLLIYAVSQVWCRLAL